MSSRRITLVADDYGLAPGVSLAIRQLLAEGRLSGTSCLTVGSCWPEAAGLLRELPAGSAEIGLHLCLTGPFAPLSPQLRVDAGWSRFPSLGSLIRLSVARRLPAGALSAEIESQHAAFVDAFGREPDFIDGHQHVHLLPGIAETLALTLRSAGLRPPWIRRCGDRPRRILCRPFATKSLFLQALSLRSDTVLADVAGRLGVEPERVIAFGDMPNDVEMLRWAGHGVAMQNGHPQARSVADEITGPAGEDGVAQVLERWF